MTRAKKTKTEKVEVEEIVASGPAGFNETTGEPLTKESLIAYIEDMKENNPKKYAKKKDELEKRLANFEQN